MCGLNVFSKARTIRQPTLPIDLILMNGKLKHFKRIVVKIGSSLLTDVSPGLKRELNRKWLASLAEDLAELAGLGTELLIVSSGAIALGRIQLGQRNANGIDQPDSSTPNLSLSESQAAAAIGQISLSRAYDQILGEQGIHTAQVLLTIGDTETRERYLNARATIGTLLRWKVIPIINENDTVATSEIRYGDNDRLAARVASMVEADLLILLSDVEGLYSHPPDQAPDARLLTEVPVIDSEIISMAGDAASIHSRGGMKTKIEAARIATDAGATMVIASGRHLRALKRLDEGGSGTWFSPNPNSFNAKKKWIAGGLNTTGEICIDQGARLALVSGKSLLPAGVVSVDGEFSRGDTVLIRCSDGKVVGRGLIECDHADAQSMIGLKSQDIVKQLGPNIRTELIHRDNLALEQTNDPS